MRRGALGHRRCIGVTDHDVLEVKQLAILDPSSEIWDILASVAFSRECESAGNACIVRIHLEEVGKESDEFIASLRHSRKIAITEAESCTHWLIDEQNVSYVEPRATSFLIGADHKVITS